MVDRFNNSARPPRHEPFDDPDFFGFQGGDFVGIQDQLPYIKGLGAGAIWLSPVLKNVPFERGTYHGYGIHNFLHADPRFARDPQHADDELRALVDAAHNLDLYVILDIVLNHTGNVFAYSCDPGEQDCQQSDGAEATFRPAPRRVRWRDGEGNARAEWPDIATIPNPPADAIVWPSELRDNSFYRRQGLPGPGDDTIGDFASLKQLRTDLAELQQFLIRAYQYVIARFDVDGFRIDTLRYLKGGLPRLFGNSIREFALSIGKKNFFTFGEVFVGDAEEEIARFIGRTTTDPTDMVGVDAALDYPLFFNLKPIIKGFSSPSDLVRMYQLRKRTEAEVLSSHGDATRFFVTFLDNHDVKERIHFIQSGNEHQFDDQVTLGLGCLYGLPGIPCLYYGTEQGLHGSGSDPAVREALWGGPGFKQDSFYYKQIREIAKVRAVEPALRYGRFYFRPISGDGQHFGVSTFPQGIVAFSRILMDEEVVVVANTSVSDARTFDVIVDSTLSKPGDQYRVRYSNKSAFQIPGLVRQKLAGSVSVQEVDGWLWRWTPALDSRGPGSVRGSDAESVRVFPGPTPTRRMFIVGRLRRATVVRQFLRKAPIRSLPLQIRPPIPRPGQSNPLPAALAVSTKAPHDAVPESAGSRRAGPRLPRGPPDAASVVSDWRGRGPSARLRQDRAPLGARRTSDVRARAWPLRPPIFPPARLASGGPGDETVTTAPRPPLDLETASAATDGAAPSRVAIDAWFVPPDNRPQRVADKRRQPMRLSALFEEFCTYLRVEQEAAPRSIQTYRWCFGDFLEFATRNVGGTVLVTHFTADRCRDYQYALAARGLQANSIRVRLATLGSFGKWAVRREKLDKNPLDLLTRPRRKARLPRVPRWDTIERLLAESSDPRERAIVALMAYGGLRRSEVVALDVGDYAPEFGLRRVRGKGGHEAAVPLPAVARVIVSEYLAKERVNVGSSDPMFVVRYRTRAGVWRESRMTGQRVWKLIKALGRRAGLPELHPHAFRHGCGVELHRRTGGNLRVVQEHLRHSDIQTTVVYTRLTQHERQQAVSVFDEKGS